MPTLLKRTFSGDRSHATARALLVIFIVGAVVCANGADQLLGMGSGFVVRADGYILTARHVIQGAEKIVAVLPDGTKRPAKVIATAELTDLALLKIDGDHFPPVVLGDSDAMEVTDYVMAIGYPLAGLIGGNTVSAYEGKINAKRNDLPVPMFQIDAAINPGNSGGPLLNDRGEVIGIVEAKLDARILQAIGIVPERISFAVPIRQGTNVLRSIFPAGWPQTKSVSKLDPRTIFNKLKPSVVLIMTYGSNSLGVGAKDTILTITLPGLEDQAPLEFVPVSSGKQLFLMGKFEVTQGQYELLMGQNPSQFHHGPNYPVESVSWEDAQKFCARLTELFGNSAQSLPPDCPKEWSRDWKFRLPTDAEWSMAAGLENERGSTPKEKGMANEAIYPWGMQWPPPKDAGNFSDISTRRKYGIAAIDGYDDGFPDTAPVGSFKPNRFGLYDLSGNVWEWCEDWLDSSHQQRVARGGSWRNGTAEAFRSSHRASNIPTGHFHNIGFRVVFGRP